MDSRIVMTESVESWRNAARDPNTVSDGLLSPNQHTLIDREHLQVDISLATDSPTSTPRWDAARVWNKALQVMVYSKKSIRHLNPGKSGSLAVAVTSESFFQNGKAAGVGVSPKDVMSFLPTEDSWISPKENGYTLVGASCSRRSSGKRNNNENEPNTSTHECTASACFDSPTSARRSSSSDINNDNSGGTSFSLLYRREKASSSRATKARHPSASSASSSSGWHNTISTRVKIGSSSEAGASSRGSSAMLAQVASASTTIMHKAISAPMIGGVLSKRKEKQD
ncbi:hypothetical protein Vretimale_17029 [Volvox reticuliferus]|uniref:Uncharacterized protein n=1 Tax=Volvox reticuliferus TaxID=1737510 RepID=A0A8J4FMP2_9CHLO|nr:hypothetical protein Vretifemale_7820 [Volvox reticuliferus]GIM13926.1 hypothetical protein Vretimale_17029 [Volvox reticuliferus]